MKNKIEELLNNYHKFLKEKTVLIENTTTGWFTINTPFVGLFNDTIELYCQMKNDKILLSDDGQTFHNLELSGIIIARSPKRKELLDRIALNYGVIINSDNEITSEANEKNFAQKKHNILAAISEISDLYYLSKPSVSSIFKEDVQGYLEEQNIIYTPHFIAKGGTTGLEFTFDFQIAGRKNEIVLKAFNSLNQLHLSNFLFGWDDIKDTRQKITGKPLHGLAIVNNDNREIKPEYLEALKNKGADYILWTERHTEENRKKLAA
jgi:hypothetical protein